MRLTPFMLTRNRSTEAFNIKHLYDFDKSTNENDHKRFLLTFLDCKYLDSCLKGINRENYLETYCRIECYSNLEN